MREDLSALPWFRRHDYEEVKRLMEGGATWPTTYEEWLHDAEDREKAIRETGARTERVMIEPYEFEVWCAAMGIPMNENARQAFAAENVTVAIGPKRGVLKKAVA